MGSTLIDNYATHTKPQSQRFSVECMGVWFRPLKIVLTNFSLAWRMICIYICVIFLNSLFLAYWDFANQTILSFCPLYVISKQGQKYFCWDLETCSGIPMYVPRIWQKVFSQWSTLAWLWFMQKTQRQYYIYMGSVCLHICVYVMKSWIGLGNLLFQNTSKQFWQIWLYKCVCVCVWIYVCVHVYMYKVKK